MPRARLSAFLSFFPRISLEIGLRRLPGKTLPRPETEGADWPETTKGLPRAGAEASACGGEEAIGAGVGGNKLLYAAEY